MSNKPFIDGGKDEKTMWIIVRSVLALIALLFVIYGFFIKQPCDVDAVFLSCRLTGTIGDWIGGALFFGGMIFLSGLHKGLKNLYNPPNTSMWNWIVFVATALGIILFWNL